MSEIKVNKISQRSGTAITLGNSGTDFQLPSGAELVAQSGSTITIAAGATITNSGTATGFGATGAVNWDTTPKTTTVTAVSGVGYFVDTTLGAITVNLPAGVAGSIVAVSDYANISATNNINITPNGTNKIDGINASYPLATNGASITFVYVDSTIGWKDVNDATLNAVGFSTFVVATGGTVLTCGDFKTHVFTGPGSFVVSQAGTPAGSNSVEYLVVAGGGGGGSGYPGGAAGSGAGGAGGYRQNYPSPTTAGLPVSVTSYPITVGGGGPGGTFPTGKGTPGVNSVFSTITSTGGGGGGSCGPTSSGLSGGSGGGAGTTGGTGTGGAGNTPPVSPPQGNSGGSTSGTNAGGGGGGAGGTGSNNSGCTGGAGGIGSPIATTVFGPTSPSYGTTGPAPGRYFAGGGGGSLGGAGGAGGGGTGAPTFGACGVVGTINTGGGGGGQSAASAGKAGGSGIVVIRYKYQ
jgi:hypothetical protein